VKAKKVKNYLTHRRRICYKWSTATIHTKKPW